MWTSDPGRDEQGAAERVARRWVGPQHCFRPAVITFARLLSEREREADVDSAGCGVIFTTGDTGAFVYK